MNKYKVLREKRKANHQCTRCGCTLPVEWHKVNCQVCNDLASSATAARRSEEKGQRKVPEKSVMDYNTVVTRLAMAKSENAALRLQLSEKS